MTFQTTVKRQYAVALPGEFVTDGPRRARTARISSLSPDANGNTNRIGRAFGWTADLPATGSTSPDDVVTVAVGAVPFIGLLCNPKRYVLQGTTAGGTLAPSIDLPQYMEGEFADMGNLFVELFNEQTNAKTTNFGDGLCYVSTATTGAQNPLGLPLGALVSYPAGGSVPAGFQAIPNARVTNDISYTASAAGALVSGFTKVQLTQ